MKSKWILLIGIAFLTLGIVLKKIGDLDFEPILLIIIGVLLKTFYIIKKARCEEYKPGFELLFLFLGLFLFASGIYLKNHDPIFNPTYLIVPGILFKVTFIILVIANIKSHRKAK